VDFCIRKKLLIKKAYEIGNIFVRIVHLIDVGWLQEE
jgi:hypothetical protein